MNRSLRLVRQCGLINVMLSHDRRLRLHPIALIPLAVLAAGAPAFAVDLRDGSYNGIVTESAVVPERNTVRVSGQGGTFGLGQGVAAGADVLWSFARALELNAGALLVFSNDSERIAQASPQFAVKWQPLRQERLGLNLALEARYKTVDFKAADSELELWLNLGRSFGPLKVVVNAVVGHPPARQGLYEIQGHAEVDGSIGHVLSLGIEGRYRGDLGSTEVTRIGSSWDLVAGPRAALKFGLVRLQILVGYGRGIGRDFNGFGQTTGGFIGMLGASADLH